MRLLLALALAALAVPACKEDAPAAPPAPVAPSKPAPAPVAGTPGTGNNTGGTAAPTLPDGGPLPPPVENAPDLANYHGFSADGLAFAYSDFSPAAGKPVMTFIAATTNTVEKRVVIADDATRKKLTEELIADGFPKPGDPVEPLPSGVGSFLENGKVVVTVGGSPAAKPFRPLADQPKVELQAARVLAMSKDGKREAVEVFLKYTGGEEGPRSVIQIVSLFE